MLGIRKNRWTAVLRLIALTAMIFASIKSSAAGELKAKIIRVGDGTANVIFQPVGNAEQVQVYNELGQTIGQLNWAAQFQLSVTEAALRAATKRDGIDLNSLLQGIGTMASGDKVLVAAELPVAIKDLEGRELAAGTQVFFGLDRLAKEGAVAPVAAWGGASMGPGGAANNFNSRLLKNGVRGSNQKVAPGPAVPHSHGGVHGDGHFPLEALDEMAGLGEKFLSSPTCKLNESARNMRLSSYYGKRPTKRATNGEWISTNHDGVDVSTPVGTPVMAAAAGCVSVDKMSFNRKVGYGVSLQIDHGNGFSTQYGHMNNFSSAIQKFADRSRSGGEKYCFARGEQIGNSGMTGRCTAPHLHFGMKKNGRSVNPRNYMMAQSDHQLSVSCSTLQANNEALKQNLAEALTPATDGQSTAIRSASAGRSASAATAN